jgi:hypothetical protein
LDLTLVVQLCSILLVIRALASVAALGAQAWLRAWHATRYFAP